MVAAAGDEAVQAGIEAAAPLVCTEITKVFGEDLAAALTLLDEGASRQVVQERTGCLIAVRDATFSVERGEIFVVMGLSGSGKSTLIRCLSRLIEPTSGTVEIDGTPIGDLDDEGLRELRRSRLSMVFQHFGLFPHRKVIDNVAFGLEIQGATKADRYERALQVLEVVGLQDWTDHFPQQLSGGMQQRVGLARALCVEPEILFFDEPFSALDPLIRRDMQDELLSLQARMRRTLVFITHDFHEALKLGDRIAIMKDGEFVQVGTPEQIVSAPADDYVREFTEDAPKTKVITVGSVMQPLDGEVPAGEPVNLDAVLDDVLPRLLANPAALPVADDQGEVVGTVDRDRVVALLDENSRSGAAGAGRNADQL
ncbi:MAG: betaine/proline/choline family ABC transporter ATP-binding protein [Acidimicrobiaceae bacterium]|nr:betaine/proline/choline family ABC transporter ATP-binding protein [Acidimicrobiaceae bacterium]